MTPADPDHHLRLAALERVRDLDRAYDGVVPLSALREGFIHDGRRMSLGSFQRGIHRPREFLGGAALSLMTAPTVAGKPRPYEDEFDPASGAVLYHYRSGPTDLADNRALLAAFEQQVPLIYFHGIAPGQYAIGAPVFVVADDRDAMRPGGGWLAYSRRRRGRCRRPARRARLRDA